MSVDSIDRAPLAERIAQAPLHLTVYQYHQLVATGLLSEDDRVELIEGRLVAMQPIGSRHANTTARLNRMLVRAAGDRAIVWVGNPVELSDDSEPQPDLALLKAGPGEYAAALPRPADTLLLIEVADSTLRYDRTVKMRLYARHGVPEYWLVDVDRLQVTVFLDPGEEGYRAETEVAEGSVRSTLLPQIAISLADLFA